MFATALRNLARRAATPLARGHAIAPRPLALAGGVSTLAAMSVSVATGCEPAPILTLAGTPGSKRERTVRHDDHEPRRLASLHTAPNAAYSTQPGTAHLADCV